MDGSHITNTSFRYSGATRIMNYAERKKGVSLENRAGQEMSEKEKEIFAKKSEYHGFERHIVMSHEDNGMTNQEVAEATRDSLNGYFPDGTDCCYAVHREPDGTVHSHGIVTGPKRKVSMYPDDLREFNRQSKEVFEEKSRSRSRALDRENEKEREHKTAREKRIDRQERNRQKQQQRAVVQQ